MIRAILSWLALAGPVHSMPALSPAHSGIRKVLIPIHPGALSAYGILVSDVVRDYSRTVMLRPDDTSLSKHFKPSKNWVAERWSRKD